MPRRSLLALVAVATMLAGARITTAAPSTGPGCAPGRPAIATNASGSKLSPQPHGAPIPCGTHTGFGAGETRIFTTKNAVIYAPAVYTPGPAGLGYGEELPGPRFQFLTSPGGLAVSKNNGATWRAVDPLGMTWQSSDEQEYVDRDTGRFFFYNFGGNPFPQTAAIPDAPDAALPPGVEAHLMWTQDDGKSWHHSTACCPLFSENPRFVAAKAPAGQPKPTGYPNAVYFCANQSIVLTLPGLARACSRSLDGGSSWSFASIALSYPIPQHAECGSSGEEFGPTDGNYPQGTPDGSLFMTVPCGGHTFLARSTDEGTTWPVTYEIPATDELRTDTAGNLYGAHRVGDAVEVRVSRDRGKTWSKAIKMSAPGVPIGEAWNIAVRAPGSVAVTYYGERAGQEAADGYITATRNALASYSKIVVWHAVVNDPKTPMLNDADPSRPPTGGVGYLDFNGADIGPDGSAWGSFVQDCGANDVDFPCGDGHEHAMWGVRGFAGRLVWP